MADKEAKTFNSFCKFFTLRVAQIVVQSRLGRKLQTISSVQARDWFNLKLEPLSDVVSQVQQALSHKYPPEVPSVCVDILLKTADGGQCLCMETWHVKFDGGKMVLGTSIANHVYHYMSTLIRSVLCASRNTPCYKYYASKQSADSFVLMYVVQKCQPDFDSLGPGHKTVCLGSVGSSYGTISVTLYYRVNMVINPTDSGVQDDSATSLLSCKYNLMPTSPVRMKREGITIPRRRTSTLCAGVDTTSFDPAPWRGSAPDLGGLANYMPSESPDFGYGACFSTSPSGEQANFYVPSQGYSSPNRAVYPGSLGARTLSNPRIRPSSRGGGVSGSSSSESGSYSAQLQHNKHDSGSGSGQSKPDSSTMFGMELSEPNSPRLPDSRQTTPRKYSCASESSLTPPAPRVLPRAVTIQLTDQGESSRPCSLPFSALLAGPVYGDERPSSLPSNLPSSHGPKRTIPHVIFSQPSPVNKPVNPDGNTSSSSESDEGFVKVGGYASSRPPFARAKSGSITAELGTLVRDCRGAPPLLKSFSVEGAAGAHRNSAPAAIQSGALADLSQIPTQLQEFTAKRVTFDEFVASFQKSVDEEEMG